MNAIKYYFFKKMVEWNHQAMIMPQEYIDNFGTKILGSELWSLPGLNALSDKREYVFVRGEYGMNFDSLFIYSYRSATGCFYYFPNDSERNIQFFYLKKVPKLEVINYEKMEKRSNKRHKAWKKTSFAAWKQKRWSKRMTKAVLGNSPSPLVWEAIVETLDDY
jgi:hypothetical protein